MRLKFVKPDKYLTRRLLAGDELELPDTKAGRLHARVYLSKRTAKEMRAPVDVPPPPPAVAAKIEAAVAPPVPATANEVREQAGLPPLPATVPSQLVDDIAAVRAQYVAAVGRQPFMGWDAATLREKIAAAKTA